MIHSRRSRATQVARIVSAVLAAAAGTTSVVALAAEPDASGLEEVLVTATRAGTTDLQTTPISVSAVTADDIDRLVAHDISGIATSVPGFSASRITAFNAASFAMRGVGLTDIIVYQDSPVGVQVDDFVMPSVQTQLLDTFDLASVEVLRGPQGTLFGKNTTGGAVNIQTIRPDMKEAGAEFRLGYGSFNEMRLQGSVDLPIVDDVFSVRLVGSGVKSDGYYKLGGTYGPINTISAFTDGHPFTYTGITGTSGEGQPNKDAGGEDVVNGRVKAEWHPNEDVRLLFQYEIMRDRSDAVPAFNDTPVGAPYLWNFLGFTRPSGDPLDHMGATEPQRFAAQDGQGPDHRRRRLLPELRMGRRPGHAVCRGGQARPGRAPAQHLPGLSAGQHGHRRSDFAVRCHARHDPRDHAVRSALRHGFRRPRELRGRRVPADQ